MLVEFIVVVPVGVNELPDPTLVNAILVASTPVAKPLASLAVPESLTFAVGTVIVTEDGKLASVSVTALTAIEPVGTTVLAPTVAPDVVIEPPDETPLKG